MEKRKASHPQKPHATFLQVECSSLCGTPNGRYQPSVAVVSALARTWGRGESLALQHVKHAQETSFASVLAILGVHTVAWGTAIWKASDVSLTVCF